MQVTLDRAADCLATETPKEYIQQIAAASQAMRLARGRGGDASSELAELRRLMGGEEE